MRFFKISTISVAFIFVLAATLTFAAPPQGGFQSSNQNDQLTGGDKIVAATISVTAPNGGEVWHQGGTYTIAWKFSGNPGWKVIVKLIPKGDPAGATTLFGNAPIGAQGVGSISWLIPAHIKNRHDYQIWIGNEAYGAKFKDISDKTFTIGGTTQMQNPGAEIPHQVDPGEAGGFNPQPEPPGK